MRAPEKLKETANGKDYVVHTVNWWTNDLSENKKTCVGEYYFESTEIYAAQDI